MNKDTDIMVKGRIKHLNTKTGRMDNYLYEIDISEDPDFDGGALKLASAVIKHMGKDIVRVVGSLSFAVDLDEIASNFDDIEGSSGEMMEALIESEYAGDVEYLLEDEMWGGFKMFSLDTAWVDPEYRKQGLLRQALTKLMCFIGGQYDIAGVIIGLCSGYTTYTKEQLEDLDNLWKHLNFLEIRPLNYDEKTDTFDNAIYARVYDFSWGAKNWNTTWATYFDAID